MPLRTDNVVPFKRAQSFWNDTFNPPKLPPLLELRQCMGLTFEEAFGILHISVDSLRAKESVFETEPPYDVSSIYHRYLYFLSQYMGTRERNIVHDHLTLRYVRRKLFYFDYALMGSMYGGYSARQWYRFEIHEEILPRDILKSIDKDVQDMFTSKNDQA